MKKSFLFSKMGVKSGIYQEIIESFGEGTVLLNNRGVIVFLNNSFCELVGGYEKKELIGKNFAAIIHFDNKSKIRRNTQKNKTKGISGEFEMILKTKQGEPIPVHICRFPVKDERGKVIGSIALLKNLNEIKSMRSKLQKAVRLRDEKIKDLNTFIYKIIHDLKSPLSNLESLINLIRKEMKASTGNSYLDMMQKSILRMQGMLGDLTILTENTKKELNVEEIDFDSLITEIKNELSNLPEFRKIIFCVKTEQKNEFRTDKRHLFTILHNLINNSYKYRSSNFPFIHIHIEEDIKGVKIEIKDNGIGIPDDLQNKIFDIFFRATEKSTGSGLGLYIVKSTVQKLHGKITVQSKENEGTRFTIYLPDLKKYFLTHETG